MELSLVFHSPSSSVRVALCPCNVQRGDLYNYSHVLKEAIGKQSGLCRQKASRNETWSEGGTLLRHEPVHDIEIFLLHQRKQDEANKRLLQEKMKEMEKFKEARGERRRRKRRSEEKRKGSQRKW